MVRRGGSAYCFQNDYNEGPELCGHLVPLPKNETFTLVGKSSIIPRDTLPEKAARCRVKEH
jgi:hypothetical protein